MLRWSAWYLLLVFVLATFYGCGGGSGSSDSTTGAITGTLVTSAGSPKALAGVTSSTPLAGVTVKVIGYDSLHAVTDSSGNFTINNVPPGSYDLLAETFVGQGATHVPIRKRGVAVAAGSNNRVGIMSLIPSGRIQGVFRLEGAADHRGIVVYTLELGRFYNAGHTWTSGGFEISGIPEGTYTLKVHKIGYEDITVHDVVVASNQQVTLDPQTLIKLPGATVRGTVEVSPLASPAALVAKLTVPKTGEYFQAEVKDGAYRFDGVVPGQYTLSVGDDLIPIGNPGTRNGQVSSYFTDLMVASNDVSVPVVPLNPGSMDTNMVANGRGFSFDSGTFTSPEQSDLYVKDLDVPLSPGVPGAPYFTFYSNGDNLALASSTGLAGFANLREVPTAGFASSVKVKSDDVIVVKTAAGNYVKLLVFGLGFSRLQGTPVNFVTFSWQLQPSGGTRFDY